MFDTYADVQVICESMDWPRNVANQHAHGRPIVASDRRNEGENEGVMMQGAWSVRQGTR